MTEQLPESCPALAQDSPNYTIRSKVEKLEHSGQQSDRGLTRVEELESSGISRPNRSLFIGPPIMAELSFLLKFCISTEKLDICTADNEDNRLKLGKTLQGWSLVSQQPQ